MELKRKVAFNKALIEEIQHAQKQDELQGMRKFIENGLFKWFIDITIFVNTILLAYDRYPFIDKDVEEKLEYVNLIFYGVFLFEMILKVAVYGCKEYMSNNFNQFDAVVVLISTVDILMNFLLLSADNEQTGGAISAFRAFRLLRIFKLAKSWKQLQTLLNTIVNTMKDIGNFSILLFLFMFLYSLAGMELFAYKVVLDDDGLPIEYKGPIKELH